MRALSDIRGLRIERPATDCRAPSCFPLQCVSAASRIEWRARASAASTTTGRALRALQRDRRGSCRPRCRAAACAAAASRPTAESASRDRSFEKMLDAAPEALQPVARLSQRCAPACADRVDPPRQAASCGRRPARVSSERAPCARDGRAWHTARRANFAVGLGLELARDVHDRRPRRRGAGLPEADAVRTRRGERP